jgi:hypothetical protein
MSDKWLQFFAKCSSVTVDNTVPTGDTVTITKAVYSTRKDQLDVEATSSASPGATLTAYDNSNPSTPVLLGVLGYNSKKDKYSGRFSWPTKPASVLVISSSGGSATSGVGGK